MADDGHLTVIEPSTCEVLSTHLIEPSKSYAVEDRTRTLGEGLKFGAGPADPRNYYRLWGEVLAAHDAGPDPQVVATLRRLDESIGPDQEQKDQ